jgi:DNA-binding Xre family transcriptional regulator
MSKPEDIPSAEELAKQIKELLHEKKLKSANLAKAMGKSRQFINSLTAIDALRNKQLEALEFLKGMEDGEL